MKITCIILLICQLYYSTTATGVKEKREIISNAIKQVRSVHDRRQKRQSQDQWLNKMCEDTCLTKNALELLPEMIHATEVNTTAEKFDSVCMYYLTIKECMATDCPFLGPPNYALHEYSCAEKPVEWRAMLECSAEILPKTLEKCHLECKNEQRESQNPMERKNEQLTQLEIALKDLENSCRDWRCELLCEADPILEVCGEEGVSMRRSDAVFTLLHGGLDFSLLPDECKRIVNEWGDV